MSFLTELPGDAERSPVRLFLRLYRALFAFMDGRQVAVANWLRVHHADLGGTLLLLTVDEGRIAEVTAYIEHERARG